MVELLDGTWAMVHLGTRLGAGQSNVFVPANVCVVGSTHVGAGESEVVGQLNQGFNADYSPGKAVTSCSRR